MSPGLFCVEAGRRRYIRAIDKQTRLVYSNRIRRSCAIAETEGYSVKKALAAALILALLVPLCACGSEPSRGDLMYEKYGTIIDMLEGENYDGAISQIREMKPKTPEPEIPMEIPVTPPGPEVLDVEITPDNFFDYYEYVDVEPEYTYDAYGNIESITLYEGLYSIRLKPEYRLYDNNSITVGYTYQYCVADMTGADFENGTHTMRLNKADKDTLSSLADNGGMVSVSKEISDGIRIGTGGMCKSGNTTTNFSGRFQIERGKTYSSFKYLVPTDFKVVRCEGTLHLIKTDQG